MTDSDQQCDTPDEMTSLQGRSVVFDTPQDVAEAVEQAFDYRGDVTLETRAGKTHMGYIFDRCNQGDDPYLRLLTPSSPDRVRVSYGDITTLTFTGRDTAAGKSWETWVKNFQEKRARGEEATIEPEALE